MRLKSLLCSFGTLLALALTVSARAQLPDQRGETYILTGNLLVSGVAFGIDFAQVADGGIDFAKQNKARLVIANSGPNTDTTLTGTFHFPTFPATGAPTAPNPDIPLTGSFDRNTGSFTMSGTLASQVILDFGVTNLGPPLGNKRIQVRLQSLTVTILGNGAVSGGQFKITQTVDSPFVFPNTPSNLVQLCLQDPQLITFGGMVDNVTNSSIILRNASAFQPAIRGTIALQGVPNIGAAAKPVGSVFFQFEGAVGNQVRTVTLNNDGTYTCYANPDVYTTIKAKGTTWLRKLLKSNLDLTRDDVGAVDGTLLAGDATDDNAADISDLLILINAYNKISPDSGYKVICDFNRDGVDDISDLLLLIANYNKIGD